MLEMNSQERKDAPVFSGVLSYFPRAMVALAQLSKAGNDKHNPGEPLHWSREKSKDHADCIARHLLEHGTVDPDDGFSHTVKVAWRALALLEVEMERPTPWKPDLTPAEINDPMVSWEIEEVRDGMGHAIPPEEVKWSKTEPFFPGKVFWDRCFETAGQGRAYAHTQEYYDKERNK